MSRVESGLPNRSRVLELLNEAYGDWGDEEYFAWKYDSYPGFQPEQHCFYIEEEDIAAFRRIFHKELVAHNTHLSTFILGDTAVDSDYRGQGYYSKLHTQTTDYCRNADADATITYNNIENITFKANKKRGWNHSILPLKLYIHSYDSVLSRYADLAISDDSSVIPFIEQISKKFKLKVSGEQIILSDIFNGEETTNKRQLQVTATPKGVARLIETASNEDIIDIIPLVGQLLLSKDISILREVGGAGNSIVSSKIHPKVDVVNPEDLSEDDRDSIQDLYRVTNAGIASYRRESQDIEHLLAYPDAEVLVVTEADEIVGFAVIGPYENANVLEARVLDIVAPSDAVFKRLIEKLEQYTATQGFDLLIMISNRDLGPEWASIDRQAIMWQELDNNSLTEIERAFPPKVTMYDVL